MHNTCFPLSLSLLLGNAAWVLSHPSASRVSGATSTHPCLWDIDQNSGPLFVGLLEIMTPLLWDQSRDSKLSAGSVGGRTLSSLFCYCSRPIKLDLALDIRCFCDCLVCSKELSAHSSLLGLDVLVQTQPVQQFRAAQAVGLSAKGRT